MAIPEYYAHSASANPTSRWQLLLCHLTEVAAIARKNGAKFSAADQACAAGLLHDLGKYSLEFQSKLAGTKSGRVDHSTAGAHIAVWEKRFGSMGRLLAYVIAGHHAGLANGAGTGDPTPLALRLAKDYIDGLPPFDAWQAEIEPLLPAAMQPPPLKRHPDALIDKERRGFCIALLVRMLFSALVDADRLDTEAFYLGLEGKTPARGDWPAEILGTLKGQLGNHLAGLSKSAPTDVNKARAEILTAAREKARKRRGLFSLTVPTGGGLCA